MSASLYTNFLANYTQQEASVNTLEQQIASGYSVQSANQNPGAFEVATIANNQISALTTDNATQASIQTKLNSVSNSYSAVSTLYDNVQSIVEQALNANGEVFVNALAGNGYSTISANSANSGTGTLLSQGVVQSAAAASFQAGTAPITLSFSGTSSNLTYTATQGGNTIATGTTSSGSTIQLAGQNFQLNGAPAAGDSFTIAPSRPQTAFDLLQGLASTLATATATPAAKAQSTQALNNALSTLAQYQQSLLTAQAQNGVTLEAVSSAGSNNSNQSTQLQLTVQNTVGVNMPTAMTQLNEAITAVTAAGKSFAAVQNLSLFQYL